MKNCPFCLQAIQDEAIKCRFCQNWLVPPPPAFAGNPMLPPQLARQTSGMAIASLVLGILWIYWLGSILALVFGYLAKREIQRSEKPLDGNGIATAGIVLGWVGIGTMVLMIGLVVIGLMTEKDKQREKPAEKSTSQHVMLVNPRREPVPAMQRSEYARLASRLPS